MTDYLEHALWAKLSKKGDDWQWGIYDEMGILLCVLTDNGFCELARDRWKATGQDNQLDEHTHWLGAAHPNEQYLQKKRKSFEKKRQWQHVLKYGLKAVRPKAHRNHWILRMEENRWIGDLGVTTDYVANLCDQLNVPFDITKDIVVLRA